jgi:hypothetical protein
VINSTTSEILKPEANSPIEDALSEEEEEVILEVGSFLRLIISSSAFPAGESVEPDLITNAVFFNRDTPYSKLKKYRSLEDLILEWEELNVRSQILNLEPKFMEARHQRFIASFVLELLALPDLIKGSERVKDLILSESTNLIREG